MTGKVLNLDNLISKDELACRISDYWMQWNTFRRPWMEQKEEIRKYVFATDTKTTTNSQNPWKNSTTIPKLCQIRDNLYANYMASLFPKRKWINWEAAASDANGREKREAIVNYMTWVIDQDRFKQEAAKCVLDYIDYGNCFATVDWVDERQLLTEPPVKVGYVGPVLRRIAPQDIVFNPTAPTFMEAPKIIRTLVSLGEVKKILESQSTSEDKEAMEELFKYLVEVRQTVRNLGTVDLQTNDTYFQVDGFGSFRQYLESDYCEILTFYGDIYNWETNELLSNHKIMIVDRHKILSKKPNPSYFGHPPIYHVGWRPRQDNLWAMGPLDNLVGMQYRIDHIENLKADTFDLIAFPVLKIKGFMDEFVWQPGTKIFCGDEGDVEMLMPPFQVLQANVEIDQYIFKMEEMAGAPKEAMGFRTPGEKTAYEVQRMENAAGRIFNIRIVQIEEQFFERVYNAMLELGRRNIGTSQEIFTFDSEFNYQTFITLTPADLTGSGRVKPVAARHFAEKAEMVQNLTNFYASGPGQDPEIRQHWSSIKLAELFEELLNLQDYEIVQQNVRISEQAESARMAQAAQGQVMMEGQTPSGLTPDDYDAELQ